MLTDLHVRDLGVISDVTVELSPGMTALTGETGAGKTLLVAALQLVLGGRAAPGLVRAGAPHALVDARFTRMPANEAPSGHDRSEQEGADRHEAPGDVGDNAEGDVGDDAEDDAEEDAGAADGPGGEPRETILSRAVPVRGRSRAWVDGRMVPVAALSDVGAGLVDIHGQHDQQTLLAAAGQRAALDQFAHADLAPLRSARRTFTEVNRRLDALGGTARERARRLDLLRYQVAEISAAEIDDVDEEAELDAEAARLAAAGALRAAAAEAATLLDDDGSGDAPVAASATGHANGALRAVAGHEPLAEWDGRLRGILAEVSDVAAELRRVVETWEDDPVRLEMVHSRLHRLAELRRKYGDTLADVVTFADAARRDIAALEAQEQEAVELEGTRAAAERAVADAEAALREVRAQAAPALGAAVTERLRELDMPDAVLEVVVDDEGAGDGVTFLLAANRGEPAQPLHRVASGGELARTMLSIRLVVEGGAPTMLFDEVDAGVGGAAALALARALHDVGDGRQVLVVTHLPQVAAHADHQLVVRKLVDGDRTATSVEPLDAEGRVVELSRMLSGHPDSATARAHAEELLLAAHAAPSSTIQGTRRD